MCQVSCQNDNMTDLDFRQPSFSEVSHINGFISMKMEPGTLRIHLGEKVKSRINVSLSEHFLQQFQYFGDFFIPKEFKGESDSPGYNYHVKEAVTENSHSASNYSAKHEGPNKKLFLENSTKNTTAPSHFNSGRAFPDLINEINSAGDNDNINGVLFHNQSEKKDFTPVLELLQLSWCCEDDSIVGIHPVLQEVSVRNLSKAFTIIAEGLSLGRTSIRFVVQRSDLGELASLHFQSSVSHDSISQGTKLWLPREYKIIVSNQESKLPFYANVLLLGNLIFPNSIYRFPI